MRPLRKNHVPIPKGIAPEHIEAAIAQLKEGVDHPFGSSLGYDLVYQGQTFPIRPRRPPRCERHLGEPRPHPPAGRSSTPTR